jgi:hypothetical protein
MRHETHVFHGGGGLYVIMGALRFVLFTTNNTLIRNPAFVCSRTNNNFVAFFIIWVVVILITGMKIRNTSLLPRKCNVDY